eukprot:gnl/MRDRNA2_/MRDRNA2_50608_c0_seq1.p1 gnl/MRDRNA2_/MRDRNA2_50608_c0~~gnl/MRDRNA2_/MRDRNA2_50608_c0_seq1.p1  ORF type:complete len:125 (-),score=29.29 gnl/MRDRNA2_/MRDRNA2_50608_c0_seq1:283-657(-)
MITYQARKLLVDNLLKLLFNHVLMSSEKEEASSLLLEAWNLLKLCLKQAMAVSPGLDTERYICLVKVRSCKRACELILQSGNDLGALEVEIMLHELSEVLESDGWMLSTIERRIKAPSLHLEIM